MKPLKKSEQGSPAAFVVMNVISVFFLLLYLGVLCLFFIYGEIPSMTAPLSTSASILVLIWFALMIFLTFLSGLWMRRKTTLKKGVILAFIAVVLSFLSPLILIGAIIGLVALLSKKK